MPHLTESQIELQAIQRLESLGYHYLYGPDIASDGHSPERVSFEQVLLLNRMKATVRRINPGIPVDAQNEAIKEIQRIASHELLANNETFHRLLTEGIPVTKRVQGDDRGDRVWLINFRNTYTHSSSGFFIAQVDELGEASENGRKKYYNYF